MFLYSIYLKLFYCGLNSVLLQIKSQKQIKFWRFEQHIGYNNASTFTRIQKEAKKVVLTLSMHAQFRLPMQTNICTKEQL